MIAPEVAYSRDLITAFRNAQHRFAERDERHRIITLARDGEVQQLMPGFFPKNFPHQIVANEIDLAARDLGELLGSLPEIHARPANPTAQNSREAAHKRTRILIDIIDKSNLQNEMYGACDRMVSFTGLPMVVDPDVVNSRVRVRAAFPQGSYWTKDVYGNVVDFWESWTETVAQLCAKFPDLKYQIKFGNEQPSFNDVLSWVPEEDNEIVEVVRYYGRQKYCLFLPGKSGLTLMEEVNPTPGQTPVFIGELPQWSRNAMRGAYDNALWVQVARSRLASFTIEAVDKAINAPIRMPKDVTNFRYGPNAKIQTDSTAANAVERVRLDVPQHAFAQNAILQEESRRAARHPEARSGSVDASVITGQGIKELLGQIDSQVQTYQDVIGRTLRDAMSYALRLDEALFPNKVQTIEGDMDGAPFTDTYTPSKDIAGNYGVKASYGLAYGMDHQRGLIFALQLRGDREIPRSVVREQFDKAFNANAEDLARLVDAEEADDALKAGIQQWIASFPAAAQMGMDPSTMLRQLATYRKLRLRGKDNAEALIEALQPTKEEQAAAQQQQAQLAANDPIQAAMQELGISDAPGPPGAVPTSPQGAAQGGLQMLMAGLNQRGQAQMSAGVSRMLPT